MKQVVVFPRGQLSAKDRRSLSKAGVCVVEADDPAKVVTMLPLPSVAPEEMLAIALESMVKAGFGEKIFLESLSRAVRRNLGEKK